MEREILFRGKRIDNGKLVEGWLSYCDEIAYILPLKSKTFFEIVQVIPETVGQFTGITDKNGKKIFEGDVTTHDFYHDRGQSGFTSSGHKRIIYYNHPTHFYSDDSNIEVIGNIHTNPELI